MTEFKINGETYTSEQYKKDLIRYWDSLRQDLPGSLGLASCVGVKCKKCMLRDNCIDQDDIEECDKYYAYDNILKIYKWAKAHPFKTNREKLKEVFGIDLDTNHELFLSYKLQHYADLRNDGGFIGHWSNHRINEWLDAEYVEPVKDY